MKVLVIGGTRFIGAFTARHLVEMGHGVVVFHRGQSTHEILPDIEHIQGYRINYEAENQVIAELELHSS